MQVFAVKDDLTRSTKFPLAAYLYNLRGILATPLHLEEVVGKVCSEISVSLALPVYRSYAVHHALFVDSCRGIATFILVLQKRLQTGS